MSWQAYVDTNLVETGKVTKAGIYGINGGGLWAKSPDFTLQPKEIEFIIHAFNHNDIALANGVRVNDEKYLTILANDRSIYAKKGNVGLCIVKTTQAILVGCYDDKIQPGECTKIVEGLADYLISVGY